VLGSVDVDDLAGQVLSQASIHALHHWVLVE
jgi:hypothetical protein